MPTVLSILALLVPIALPVAALMLTSRLGFWWRAGAALLASLVSLPVGVYLALVGHQPDFFTSDYAAPGAGIFALPALLLWAVSFVVTIIWIIVKLVSRLRRSSKSSPDT